MSARASSDVPPLTAFFSQGSFAPMVVSATARSELERGGEASLAMFLRRAGANLLLPRSSTGMPVRRTCCALLQFQCPSSFPVTDDAASLQRPSFDPPTPLPSSIPPRIERTSCATPPSPTTPPPTHHRVDLNRVGQSAAEPAVERSTLSLSPPTSTRTRTPHPPLYHIMSAPTLGSCCIRGVSVSSPSIGAAFPTSRLTSATARGNSQGHHHLVQRHSHLYVPSHRIHPQRALLTPSANSQTSRSPPATTTRPRRSSSAPTCLASSSRTPRCVRSSSPHPLEPSPDLASAC